MAVDLHTHSAVSDGSDTPSEVVTLAARRGLTAVALTDHDTLAGIPEATKAAGAVGIEFVPGIELSVDWAGGNLHLLVYFLEPGPGPLQDRLGAVQRSRDDRNRQIVRALNDLDIDVTYGEVQAVAGTGVVGRPHFARVLVDNGIVADAPEAFDRFLAAGRPAYRERMRLSISEAIALARASGAVPVVAHPHTMGVSRDEFHDVIAGFVAEGLGGIEAYYAEYPIATRNRLALLADSLGIVATGGSDYHGSFKPALRLGIGYGDLSVPDRVVADLKQAR
jgi:predicted metal-dependent phosphoesterase TrpH